MTDGAAPSWDRPAPTVLCLGRGYALRFAGWVLARAGAEVEYARTDLVAAAAEEWPEPVLRLSDEQVLTRLSGVDICITDSIQVLAALVGGDDPWPAALSRLVLAEIQHPGAQDDANALIAEMSGVGAVIGEQDGPGMAPPGRMLEAMVGLQAATAALAGWLAAGRDGIGEHVRIDPVRCVAVMSGVNALQFLNYGRPWRRAGRSASGSGGPFPFRMFRCHDGWVVICRSRSEWEAFVAMLGSPGWSKQERFADPLYIATHHAEEAAELVTRALSERSVADVVAAARRHRVPLAPLRSIGEALADARLFRRRQPVDPMPAVTMSRPAPKPVSWFGRAARRPAAGRPGPLAGLRVLDLGWVWAAPIASAWLADLGADVIKVESLESLDVARRRGMEFPAGGESARSVLPGYERAWLFNATNRNKRSVRMELKQPADRRRFLELVEQADVLVESFAEGVMERLGIAPEELLERNPALIVVSMGGRTIDGQYAARSYAPILTATAGIESMVRDAAGDPLGLLSWGVADPNAGAWAVFSVVSAIAAGQGGSHLLVSQLRSLVNTCASAYRGADPPPIELADAQEVKLEHLEGLADGPLGDLYRSILTTSWSPAVGLRRAFAGPWEFRRTSVSVACGAPLVGSTPIGELATDWGVPVEVAGSPLAPAELPG